MKTTRQLGELPVPRPRLELVPFGLGVEVVSELPARLVVVFRVGSRFGVVALEADGLRPAVPPPAEELVTEELLAADPPLAVAPFPGEAVPPVPPLPLALFGAAPGLPEAEMGIASLTFRTARSAAPTAVPAARPTVRPIRFRTLSRSGIFDQPNGPPGTRKRVASPVP